MAEPTTAQRACKLFEKCALFSALDERQSRELAAYARFRSFAVKESICRASQAA